MAQPVMWKSKLNNSYEKKWIEKQDSEHHKELKRLRALPDNRLCADCGADGVCWAAINLGVFVCIRCASIHRSLGTHISKVKGCTGTYLWGPDEMRVMKHWGNAKANAHFLAQCSGPSAPPPLTPGSGEADLMQRATQKYGDLRWAANSRSIVEMADEREAAAVAAAAASASASATATAKAAPKADFFMDLTDDPWGNNNSNTEKKAGAGGGAGAGAGAGLTEDFFADLLADPWAPAPAAPAATANTATGHANPAGPAGATGAGAGGDLMDFDPCAVAASAPAATAATDFFESF